MEKQGHLITDKWIESAYRNLKSSIVGNLDEYYQRKLKAIFEADVVIAESSLKSFSVGHQITTALAKAKPVLLLKTLEQNKKVEPYIEGVNSTWLIKKRYKDDTEALSHILEFLETFGNKRTVRFNLVMSHEENSFLEDLKKQRNQNKTEIIKTLIREEMNKKSKK